MSQESERTDLGVDSRKFAETLGLPYAPPVTKELVPAPQTRDGALRSADSSSAPSQHSWDSREAVARAVRGELSAEVLGSVSSQLAAVALLSSGLLALASLLTAALPGPADEALSAATSLLFAATGVALLWFLVTQFTPFGDSAKRDLGHVFLFVLCLLLGIARHQGAPDLSAFHGVAPASILVVAFAALVPATPRVAFGVCFGAASMELLGWVFAHGNASLSTEPRWPLLLFSPVVTGCASLGVSRVVHRLRQGIQKAQEVGNYRLIEPLGSGGMAEVWRAEHRLLARPAAVKLIRPEVLTGYGPEATERLIRLFLREAKATSQLSSPHTILLYDFGITREGSFYYVMELLRGMDLKRLVEQFGPQPPERCAWLLNHICRSLREAHERAYVHRDLKPANVFTCKLGEEFDFVKVLDFGLVLDRNPTAEELEDQKSFVGTPAIMAPEMIRYQSKVDARADIYSLGCIGYWLLTGHHVFEAESRADMLVMHAHQKPVLPSRRLGHPLHAGLEELIMSCLEKNPSRRPQSAAELEASFAELAFDTPWTQERASLWWRRENILDEEKRKVPPTLSELDVSDPGVRGGGLPLA